MFTLLPVMRALSDDTRLRIVLLLRRIELSVGEIVQILNQSQPRVSRHLAILEEAGLIEKHKEGSWVFLRPSKILLKAPLHDLLTHIQNEDIAVTDKRKLEAIRIARAQNAENYFKAHANEWDRLRNLHVPEAQVEQTMLTLLSRQPLGRVLDIGTGTGRVIEMLAERADFICGYDKNAEMLRIARAKIAQLVPDRIARDRVELMMGDFNRLPFEKGSFDSVIFHQVLHYAHDPKRALDEAARVLAPGAQLLVVDFAAHQREELRYEHAHARLGFSDAYIADLFSDMGLDQLAVETLKGKELTVKLWLARAPKRAQDIISPTSSNIESAVAS